MSTIDIIRLTNLKTGGSALPPVELKYGLFGGVTYPGLGVIPNRDAWTADAADEAAIEELLIDWSAAVGARERMVFAAVLDGRIVAGIAAGFPNPGPAWAVVRGSDDRAVLCEVGGWNSDGYRVLWHATKEAAEAAAEGYREQLLEISRSEGNSIGRGDRAIASLNIRVVPTRYHWADESLSLDHAIDATIIDGYACPRVD